MKKFLFTILIVLLAVNVYAISIPDTEQIINASGEEAVWLMGVYNNEGATLDAGDVVVWDIASSTGDNDYYVKKVSETDTFMVAGIVYGKDIASSSNGVIAVKGIVDVDVTGTVNTGTLLCTSNTTENGYATACSSVTSDADAFGFSLGNISSGSVKAYIFGR